MRDEHPPIIHRAVIGPEWIDYNGHFNAGYYVVVFDDAIGPWLSYCGLTREHRRVRAVTTFTVESHVTYQRELHEGDELEISGQLLDFAPKKIHSFLRMFHARDGSLAATYEIMTLHIDLATRRPAVMAPEVQARLAAIKNEQLGWPRPPQAGRVIGVAARRPG